MIPAVGALDSPLRELFSRIEPWADSVHPDLPAIGKAVADLAADHDYFAPAITAMGDVSGVVPLQVPERGPRLFLVHRRTGQMGAVHDHKVWVALAPIVGVETHRRWRPLTSGDRRRLEMVETEALQPGHSVTLQPPDDIHDHGHGLGVGSAAYLLILLGDDQFRHRRHEWDPDTERWRTLEPGDRGRWLASEPFPG